MINNKSLMISVLLTVIVLIAFWQVAQCDFIMFDDNQYVAQNQHIQNGMTIDGVRWAFTTGHAANWHPLTWIST